MKKQAKQEEQRYRIMNQGSYLSFKDSWTFDESKAVSFTKDNAILKLFEVCKEPVYRSTANLVRI